MHVIILDLDPPSFAFCMDSDPVFLPPGSRSAFRMQIRIQLPKIDQRFGHMLLDFWEIHFICDFVIILNSALRF